MVNNHGPWLVSHLNGVMGPLINGLNGLQTFGEGEEFWGHTWRMGSQDGWIRGDRMGPPIYSRHEGLGHLEGVQSNLILRGLTTY